MPAEANLWHRVTVIGRPDVPPGSSSVKDNNREDPEQGRKRQEREGGAAGVEVVQSPRNPSSSVFLVQFESGKTVSLDLSQVAIKWVYFCGVDSNGRKCSHGVQEQQQAKIPPGAGMRDGDDDGGDVLAYDSTDVGTRVDVWWPRYNSYFRAAVRVACDRIYRGGGGDWVIGGEKCAFLAQFFLNFCSLILF